MHWPGGSSLARALEAHLHLGANVVGRLGVRERARQVIGGPLRCAFPGFELRERQLDAGLDQEMADRPGNRPRPLEVRARMRLVERSDGEEREGSPVREARLLAQPHRFSM